MDTTAYTVANTYAGTCAQCSSHVEAGAGFRSRRPNTTGQGPKWPMICRTCQSGGMPTPVSQDVPLEQRPTFPLTDEQQRAVDLAMTGESVAIQAGAGTGKTSTLVAIGKASDRPMQFVAFNKKIVRDASRKMPRNVTCSTMSSLAYQQVGVVHYKARLNRREFVPASQFAQRIGLRNYSFQYGQETVNLQPGRLMGLVKRAIATFCYTADTELSVRHFEYVDGVDPLDAQGKRTYSQNDRIKAMLLPYAVRVWADYVNTEGQLPGFNLTHVEKIWELGVHGKPVVPGSTILFDEAQDANPVYLSVVQQQGKQVIFVGDSQQQINEWRGCVNAMAEVSGESTCYLTNSFRFGPEVAEVANRVLARIDGAELRITGRGPAGTVGAIADPDAIMCRTNAAAFTETLAALDEGRRPFLMGGGGEVEAFAKAARKLMNGESTEHPDLAWASTWGEVQTWSTSDDADGDVAKLVKLVDDFGVERILQAVANAIPEDEADVVISTVHKAKGGEWDTVKLAGDFNEARISEPADLRLLYVAVTRAKVALDYTTCPAMLAIDDEAGVIQ